MNPQLKTIGQGPQDHVLFRKPARVIDLNDVFGGESSVFQRSDPEAHITKLVRSGVRSFRREFDIFGREEAVPYIVAETARLLRETQHRQCFTQREKLRYWFGKTLILANCEPRNEQGNAVNGNEFLVARVMAPGLQVVGSPIALRNVKNLIREEDLYRCPNDTNYYFPPGDQFRSASFELLSHKAQKLVPASLDAIPDPLTYPHLAYVDRFGNQKLRTPNDDAFQQQLDRESVPVTKGVGKGEARRVGLGINGNKLDFFVLGNETLGTSLKGELIQYRNHTRDRTHNLAYGWIPGLTALEKQERSPHGKFDEPPEGSPIEIR